MSAIGSYEVLAQVRFAECLTLARNVATETTGRWIFSRTRTTGLGEFQQAWRAAVLQKADFEYSGYVLGDYLDAVQAIGAAQAFYARGVAGITPENLVIFVIR